MFLIESKLTVSEMQLIKIELDFPSMHVVPSVRHGGGLALLWKNDVVVSTQTYSPNHIDAHVTSTLHPPSRMTGIYGHPEERLKCETWRLLRHLRYRASLPRFVWATLKRYFGLRRNMAESQNHYSPCRTSRVLFSVVG